MTLNQLLILFGKLHPIVVHFPLAFLVTAALIELFRLRSNHSRPGAHALFCLTVGTIGAVVASVFGWIAAGFEEFHGSLESVLFIHRWLGVSVTGFAIVSLVVGYAIRQGTSKGRYRAYLFLVWANAVLVGIGSHYGGIMVHGEDYYSEIFDEVENHGDTPDSNHSEERASLKSSAVTPDGAPLIPAAIDKHIDFRHDIKPLLKRSCYRCHGGGQAKGKFRIDSRDLFLKGGKTGPAVVVGDSEQSLVTQLVSGVDPDKIMPNKGRGLSPSEIGVLRAWIDQGLVWESETSGETFLENSFESRRVNLPSPVDGVDSHPLDYLLQEYFRKNHIEPPSVVSDHIFARRAYLDTIGRVPTSNEVRQFENQTGTDKRAVLVEYLLSLKEQYSHAWLPFWNDLLRNDYTGAGFVGGGRKQLTGWLRQALLNNKPYDQLVKELIAPTPRSDAFIRGIVWQGNVNPNERPEMQAAQNIGQVFLGINLKCASCHDSFTDEWTLEQSYGLANVFAKKPLETHECDRSTGKFAPAQFLYPKLGSINSADPIATRREALATIITSDKNGRFARTIVNRFWKKFFGRGLIEPVDQGAGSPWDRDLLDWLAQDFVQNGYDLKHLMSRIMTSRAYQLAAIPRESAEIPSSDSENTYQFRGPHVRALTAEQFFDSISSNVGASAPFSGDDFKRYLRIERSRSQLLRFRSGPLDAQKGVIPIDVSIQGAKSVWLILTELKKEKAVVANDKSDAKVKLQEPTDSRSATFGVWRNPQVISASGSFPLVGRSPDQTYGDFVLKSSGRKTAPEFHVHPFSFARFNFPSTELNRFVAEVSVIEPHKAKRRRRSKFEFLVLTDLHLRAAYLEQNPLLEALGRPQREQVVTNREEELTTLRALTLENGSELMQLVQATAHALKHEANGNLQEAVTLMYRKLFGREPSAEETDIARDALTNGDTGLSDLVWALLLSPELQLIA